MEHSMELNEMSAALERLSEYDLTKTGPVTSEYVNAVSKTLEFLSKQDLTAIDDAALGRVSDAALEAVENADRVRERRRGPVAPDTPPPANRRTRPPCWYTVKPRNTLEWISRHFYGHERYWGEIWRANPGIINPNLLEPGWELWIPSLGGVHEQVN